MLTHGYQFIQNYVYIVEVECDFKQNGNPEMRCSTNALFETTTRLH